MMSSTWTVIWKHMLARHEVTVTLINKTVRCLKKICFLFINECGSVVGWGTMLLAGTSRVRFPMRSLDFFFFDLPNPSSCTMALGSIQPLTEMSTRNFPGVSDAADAKGWQYYRRLWADCLEDVGASTSQNPTDLHGLLRGYKLNSVAIVRKRTIPTERPPLVVEISTNICG
jgi:hypothetical protein